MPSFPATAQTNLRPDLAMAMERYPLQASQAGFIALQVFPVIEVPKKVGRFEVRNVEDLLQEHDTARAPTTGYARGGGGKTGTPITWATTDHGFEELIDDSEDSIYSDYFDSELDASRRARDVVLRNHERRVTALASGTGVTNTTAAGTAWDQSAATPIDNVRAAKVAIYNRVGLEPNTLIVPWGRFEFLKDNAQIIDRMKYQGFVDVRRENINAAMLATVFNVERVIVAGAQRNSANEAKTAVLAPIWPVNTVLLAVTARTKDHKEPCIGRTFHWGEDGSEIGGVIETYREDNKRSDVVRVRMDTDEQLIYEACGQRITGT